jgi:hypothetical protein
MLFFCKKSNTERSRVKSGFINTNVSFVSLSDTQQYIVWRKAILCKYLLKYTPLKSECMGNEGLYSSEHDTAFRSLISDIDEDLIIHKKHSLWPNYLKNICLICPIISLRHTLLLNFVNKGNNKITELRTILQRESQNS